MEMNSARGKSMLLALVAYLLCGESVEAVVAWREMPVRVGGEGTTAALCFPAGSPFAVAQELQSHEVNVSTIFPPARRCPPEAYEQLG
jgi:hypothetical protein